MRHSPTVVAPVLGAWFCMLLPFAALPVSAEPGIPATVTQVKLFAAWEDGDATGFYRGIVTVPEPGKATFTLQWIAVGPEGQLSEVRHSLPIPEVETLSGLVIDFRGEVDTQGLTVFIDVQEAPDVLEETYVLYVDGPDAYTFEGASN